MGLFTSSDASVLFAIFLTLPQQRDFLFLLSFLADCCNSLWAGLPLCTIKRLQHVQNCAARLILRAPRYEHTSTLLKQFHWLPIPARILLTNTIVLLSLLSALTLSPSYLSDRLHLHRSCRSLRSSEDTLITSVPKFNCKIKQSSFSYFAAKSWNSLPPDIRHAKTLDKFKSKHKSYLITVHFT